MASLLGMFLTNGDVFQNVLRRTQGHRSSLMDTLWLDVQDVLQTGGGHPTCLLYDEGHGVAFVEQPQL